MPGNLDRTLVGLLFMMLVVSVSSINMFLPALEAMAGDFGVDYGRMAWAISGYLMMTAVFQIFIGQAADRLGRRPVLLFCIGVFVASSLGCALSETYTVFMAFRVLQATIVTGLVLSRAIVGDSVEKRMAASVLGYMAMVMSLAPIFGPVIGGFLAEYFGWRSNFHVYAAMGVILLVLVWLKLPETRRRDSSRNDTFVTDYLRLLGNSRFWAHTLIISLGIGSFFIFVSGIPLVAASEYSLDQFEIGLAMGSMTCGFLLGSFLSGKLSTSHTPGTMILSGRMLATLGVLASIGLIMAGSHNLWTLLGGIAFVGLGNGITNPSSGAAAMYVDRELAGSASGLGGASIAVTGALCSAGSAYFLELYPSPLVLLTLIALVTAASLAIALWVLRQADDD